MLTGTTVFVCESVGDEDDDDVEDVFSDVGEKLEKRMRAYALQHGLVVDEPSASMGRLEWLDQQLDWLDHQIASSSLQSKRKKKRRKPPRRRG